MLTSTFTLMCIVAGVATAVRGVGRVVRELVLCVRRQWHLRLQLHSAQSAILPGNVHVLYCTVLLNAFVEAATSFSATIIK